MKPIIHMLILICGLFAATCYGQTPAPTPKAEFSFTATKVGATGPATAFNVGDEIDVVLYVRDLRPAGTWYGPRLVNGVNVTKTWPKARGVFSAYADVPVDLTVLSIGSVSFGANYPDGQRYVNVGGFLDDIGAFTQTFAITGLGTSKQELMRFRCKCSFGDATLQCYFDRIQSPEYDTLVFGNDAATPPEGWHVNAGEISSVPLTISVR